MLKTEILCIKLFNIFSIAMSYNPLIQIVKRKMIHDNEVEADRFVLNNINKNEFRLFMRKLLWIRTKNPIFRDKIY